MGDSPAPAEAEEEEEEGGGGGRAGAEEASPVRGRVEDLPSCGGVGSRGPGGGGGGAPAQGDVGGRQGGRERCARLQILRGAAGVVETESPGREKSNREQGR